MSGSVGGLSMQSVVKQVEKLKGPEGIEKLEKKLGSSVKYFAFRQYPVYEKQI